MKTALITYSKYVISMFANAKINLVIAKLIIPVSVVIYYVQKYLFSEWEFLVFLIGFMLMDTCTGFVLAWKKKIVCRNEFSKVFIKGFAYMIFLFTVHGLTHVKITGRPIPFLDYVDYLALSGLMIREAISIFDKISKLSPGLVPKWLRKRLVDFDDLSGELISKEKENEPNAGAKHTSD